MGMGYGNVVMTQLTFGHLSGVIHETTKSHQQASEPGRGPDITHHGPRTMKNPCPPFTGLHPACSK